MSYDECTEIRNDKVVVLKDKKSRATFEINNPKQIDVYKTRVDGCLIVEDVEKCDWLVRTDVPSKVLRLIELKGKKIDKAISQLENTLRNLPRGLRGYTKECYVVSTACPKGRTSNLQRKVKFKRENKSELQLKNMKFVIEV